MSNSASYGGRGVPTAVVSLEDEFAAFDRLPNFLRDRLNYAAYKGAAPSLLKLYEEQHAAGVPDWYIAASIDQVIYQINLKMRAADAEARASIRLSLNGTKRQALRRRVDPKLALQRAEDRQRRVQEQA